MNFKIHDIIIPQTLYLTEPIEEVDFTFLKVDLHSLDREGYQLTPLEEQYYAVNKIKLTKQAWIGVIQMDQYYYLDRSYCIFRMGFAGKAKEQLLEWCKIKPELRRLVDLKPKCGLSFCLDYTDSEGALELIHMQWDYETIEGFLKGKVHFEKLVSEKDWSTYLHWIRGTKSIWKNMNAEEQGNFKAQKLGLPIAMRQIKGF